MSKKLVNIVLIIEFDIRDFSGLGEFFDVDSVDWRLATWRFLQFNIKFHIHSVSSYAPLSVDDTAI
jgi:hypothetical protein